MPEFDFTTIRVKRDSKQALREAFPSARGDSERFDMLLVEYDKLLNKLVSVRQSGSVGGMRLGE